MFNKIRYTIALCAAACVSLMAPTAASAQGDEAEQRTERDQRADLKLLLSAHHDLPDKHLFLKASPDARALLLELARDASQFKLHRYRALEALGAYWADDEVFELYARLLAGKGDVLLKHRVMMFAAAAFGDRSVPLISPYSHDADVQLRMTAAEALIRVNTETSRAALRAALGQEDEPMVRRRIEGGLAEIR